MTDWTKERRLQLGLLLIRKILEAYGVPEGDRERLVQIHARPWDYSPEERTEVHRIIVKRMEEIGEKALNPNRKKVGRDARYLAEALRTINRLAEQEEARGQEVEERQERRSRPSPTWSEDG